MPILGLDIGKRLLAILRLPPEHEVTKIHLHCDADDVVRLDVQLLPSADTMEGILTLLGDYEIEERSYTLKEKD